eukprot:9466880-Lingulodinium_polyedra.AAC.1
MKPCGRSGAQFHQSRLPSTRRRLFWCAGPRLRLVHCLGPCNHIWQCSHRVAFSGINRRTYLEALDSESPAVAAIDAAEFSSRFVSGCDVLELGR